MSINFDQLRDNISDFVRTVVSEEISNLTDAVCRKIEMNLDMERELDWDELVREEIENTSCTVTCSRCGDDPDVDSFSFSYGELEVSIDGCSSCSYDDLKHDIENNWEIIVRSINNDDMELDTVEVDTNRQSIMIMTRKTTGMPIQLFTPKIGPVYVHKYFVERVHAENWLNTDEALQLINSINMVHNTDITPQIVTIQKGD